MGRFRIPNRGVPWTPYQKRLATNLKKYMVEKKLTISEVCERSGVCHQTIRNYLDGQIASPSLKHVTSISYALGIPIKDLLA